jgi:hypothetical protein
MSLSVYQGQVVISIVAADPDCRKVIRHPGQNETTVQTIFGWLSGGIIQWAVLERLGIAGWVRNAFAGLVLSESDPRFQRLLCGGIVAVTVAALDKKKGMLPGLRDVQGASREPRAWGVNWAHFATLLLMNDNTNYVFDWHKTLNISNPWVSKQDDWQIAQNEIPFSDFQGFN